MEPRPEPMIVHAVALLHERGLQGVRIRANFYATGHWRCRVFVAAPGDDRDIERDRLLAYTNGRGFDVFGDGRTEWDAASLADALEGLALPYAHARRADPAYVAWLREVRERTGGGHLSMYEDAYTPEQDWPARGLVQLLPTPEARRAHEGAEWTIGLPPAP
ncbi:hypothetical protein ABZ477_16800 [Microbacterium sp. NPDC019599]|uniref:hypothetical protein n=1 Tax=Microbacterium sp. NPDC019599 TaxID=3154690 RepID=UPI0033D37FD3